MTEEQVSTESCGFCMGSGYVWKDDRGSTWPADHPEPDAELPSFDCQLIECNCVENPSDKE